MSASLTSRFVHPIARCVKAGCLYLAWTKAAPDVQARHRKAYINHLRSCETCRAHLDQRKKLPPYPPDLTEEEIANA